MRKEEKGIFESGNGITLLPRRAKICHLSIKTEGLTSHYLLNQIGQKIKAALDINGTSKGKI